MPELGAVRDALVTGAVAGVAGHEVEIRGLRLGVGDALVVHTSQGDRMAEVVGVSERGATALLLADSAALTRGDRVSRLRSGLGACVGPALLGRVVDALGRPLDGLPAPAGEQVPLHAPPPAPLDRRRVTEPLPVGVRMIDTLCTTGRGQRIGIFAGSGVGKSTLLGMMVRGTTADVNVVALIGERGREVREFIEDELGPEGLARSIVVVATSDEPPLMRLRAAFLATAISTWFADQGNDVLLTLDSLTRLATSSWAMAQRDVGLAAGEPPTARGYTPSVFTLLPSLLERVGPRANGTVTAFYTVLVDGDDMNDPVADAARSILDGHLVLERKLAHANHYPPIDPLASLSRLAAKITDPEQAEQAGTIRAALAAAEEVRDLVEVGAYVPGTNPAADIGLAVKADIIGFLRQTGHDLTPFGEAWARLAAIAARCRAGEEVAA